MDEAEARHRFESARRAVLATSRPDGGVDLVPVTFAVDRDRLVAILRKAKPEIRFTLELITRDPLKVPCLLPEYWVTFPQLPASDLARTLRYVRDHTSDQLQDVTSLSAEARLKLEDQNVRASLDYARDVGCELRGS